MERSAGGEDCVNVCGEKNDGAGGVSRQVFGRQDAENVSGSVDFDRTQSGFSEAPGQPFGALALTVGGAGMATSSTCQSMMVLGFACSQAKAA